MGPNRDAPGYKDVRKQRHDWQRDAAVEHQRLVCCVWVRWVIFFFTPRMDDEGKLEAGEFQRVISCYGVVVKVSGYVKCIDWRQVGSRAVKIHRWNTRFPNELSRQITRARGGLWRSVRRWPRSRQPGGPVSPLTLAYCPESLSAVPPHALWELSSQSFPFTIA
ncbi:hypothetical protein BX600DRAFT_199916 [Xylariales sp. PMI_506]|nr:hypothetical protein BX600DRAFT_199916 [Xylariales sp. PMI_506]